MGQRKRGDGPGARESPSESAATARELPGRANAKTQPLRGLAMRGSAPGDADLHSTDPPEAPESTVNPLDISQTIGSTGTSTRRSDPQRAQPDAPVLPAGTVVGRYMVLDKIAAGGMGAVYKAYDPELDRRVAVKVVSVAHDDQAAAASAAARLVREAKSLAQLSHPNVVAVYDVGSFGDDVFIAMALVEGKTLRDWNEDDGHSLYEILEVFQAAGRGLAAAHQAGIVHRDFKPDNVLVGDDGRVQVVDFGIARADDVDQAEAISGELLNSSTSGTFDSLRLRSLHSGLDRLTKLGALVGTPSYMSPEQFLGAEVDAKADQFSFCVALYESLYGKRPFKGKRVAQLRDNVVAGKMREPSKDSRVPAYIRRAIVRGLAVDPRDRYGSMEELLADLADNPMARRKRWLALFLVATSIAVAAFAVVAAGDSAKARCKAASRAVDRAWSNQTHSAIVRAFGQSEISYAANTGEKVSLLLSARAMAWSATRKDICEATWVRGEQSESLLDTRMHCLDRRLNEMTSLVTMFSGDVDRKLIDRSVQAVFSLKPIEACAQLVAKVDEYPMPSDPKTRTRIALLQDRIDELEVMLAASRNQQGVETGEAVLKEALSLGYAPLAAEAQFTMGMLLASAGEFERAVNTFADGLSSAARARDHRRAALMAAKRIYVVGYHLDRHIEALAMVPAARAAVIRADETPEVKGALLEAVGSISYAQGNYAEASETMRQRLELIEPTFKPGDPRLGSPLNSLGLALVSQKKYAEGISYLERARDVWQQALGEEHPAVAIALTNLGMAYKFSGRDDDSFRAHKRALHLFEKAHGPDHPNVGTALMNVGALLESQGRLAEAENHYLRALAIHEARRGPRHQAVGLTCGDLAAILHRRGKIREALGYYRRAIDVLEATVGSKNQYTALAIAGLGRAHLDLGNPGAAIAPLERGLPLLQAHNSQFVAETQFALARALWQTGKDKSRSRRLAKSAQGRLAEAPSPARDQLRSEVEQWLSRHRLGRRSAR